MQLHGKLLLAGFLIWTAAPGQTPPPANPAAQPGAPPTFRTETRLVPVDVVVTDKKGNYIHDLTAKDFKVWEDNKEQTIKNFSFEADPASPLAQQKKYTVLFFDLSSMNAGDQVQARQSAAKFIDASAGPNRLIAVVNYGGWMQIAQNFTDDVERLKQVVAGIKTSAIVSNTGLTGPAPGEPRLGSAGGEFGARSVLMALRNLAKNLQDVPGRKTLIFFSSGFPSNSSEIISEMTATVDACNRANIAVYPLDVRGLVVMPFAPRGAVMLPGVLNRAGIALAGSPVLRLASFLAAPQRGGSSGGSTPPSGGGAPSGGGGAPSSGGGGVPSSRAGGSGLGGTGIGNTGNTGGFGGSRTGTGMGGNTPGFGGGSIPTNSNPNRGGPGNIDPRYNPNDPRNARGILLPRFPESVTTNQQVLYTLAAGTGGFVIANTNDLAGGLAKINREQNEYYLLAYTPPESLEGTCHTIRVKIQRGGTNVRARSGYCNVKGPDLLSGKPAEKELEARLTGTAPGKYSGVALQAPYFFTSANAARVNVVIDIPTGDVKFQKVKGKQHAEITVLGVAYRPNGNVAARFSDAVKLDYDDKKEMEAFLKKPFHYENQFDAGPGEYLLKLAFSAGGENFGKAELPLRIDPYDGKQFAMSSLVLSTTMKRLTDLEQNLDSELLEGRVPLVAQGYQFTPSSRYEFKTSDQVLVYFEIYEPLLAEQSPATPVLIAGQLRILDAKGEPKLDSGGVDLSRYARSGNPVVPVGLKVPLAGLAVGKYTVALITQDSAGKSTSRTAVIEVL